MGFAHMRLALYQPTLAHSRTGTGPGAARWRWKNDRGRPNKEHMMALLELAGELGLAHIFTG